MNVNKILTITLLIAYSVSSCKKLVEVDAPATSVSYKNAFNNNATALGAVTAIYVDIMLQSSSISQSTGLSADELTCYSAAGNTALATLYQNKLTSQNIVVPISDCWSVIYRRMFRINLALEGLTASSVLTPEIKQQLIGEIKFLRAFDYFFLVNLYGDVPLVLTTDYTINSLIKKSAKQEVYKQIISDLNDSQQLLSARYLKGDGLSSYPLGEEQRVRATKWAAMALKAKVYLYMGDWIKAEELSSQVINQKAIYNLESLDRVFLKDSKEAIWQLQPGQVGANTPDAIAFVLPSAGPSSLYPVYLSDDLVNNFEIDDQRKVSWIGNVNTNGLRYFFPYKYKVIQSMDPNAPITEYGMVLRLADQYLIRAEARAKLDNLSGAITDLDEIRKRAGLKSILIVKPNVSKMDLIISIYKERQLELFTEWGNRWFDLKRTEKVDEVMTLVTPKKSNGGVWKSYQQYYPIPLSEIKANPNLIQVTGY